MKFFCHIIWLFCIFGCSNIPNDVPIDSMRSVIFNVDMNQIIESGEFNSELDTLYLILDDPKQYVMEDQDHDGIFTFLIINSEFR